MPPYARVNARVNARVMRASNGLGAGAGARYDSTLPTTLSSGAFAPFWCMEVAA